MANLVVTGTVTSMSAIETGISMNGKEWNKKTVVVTESEGQYPKSVAFSLMNRDLVDMNFSINESVTIHANVESREFNGKWYTNITAWKIDKVNQSSPQPTESPEHQYKPTPPLQTDGQEPDLPF